MILPFIIKSEEFCTFLSVKLVHLYCVIENDGLYTFLDRNWNSYNCMIPFTKQSNTLTFRCDSTNHGIFQRPSAELYRYSVADPNSPPPPAPHPLKLTDLFSLSFSLYRNCIGMLRTKVQIQHERTYITIQSFQGPNGPLRGPWIPAVGTPPPPPPNENPRSAPGIMSYIQNFDKEFFS